MDAYFENVMKTVPHIVYYGKIKEKKNRKWKQTFFFYSKNSFKFNELDRLMRFVESFQSTNVTINKLYF